MELDLGKVVGSDGVSPVITESKDNTSTVYKLDIKTADNEFTTPNLKGESANTNGLSFGQDDEGNWGYIVPGADTVTPFKQGGGLEDIVVTQYFNMRFVYATANLPRVFYLPTILGKLPKKVVINGRVGSSKTSSTITGRSTTLRLYYYVGSTSSYTDIITFPVPTSTSVLYTNVVDLEIDCSDFIPDQPVYAQIIESTSNSGNARTVDFTLDMFF